MEPLADWFASQSTTSSVGPRRVLFKNEESDIFLFWNSVPGRGWSIGPDQNNPESHLNENSRNGCGGKRRKRAATRSCSSEPADACKAEGGYCGSPGSCPGTVIDNKCPGGQDNKCCTAGMPFQESECEATGGDCLDTCKCPGGNYLHGYCPSQPNSIKCCPRPTEPEPEMCETDAGAGMISKYISRVID